MDRLRRSATDAGLPSANPNGERSQAPAAHRGGLVWLRAVEGIGRGLGSNCGDGTTGQDAQRLQPPRNQADAAGTEFRRGVHRGPITAVEEVRARCTSGLNEVRVWQPLPPGFAAVFCLDLE